MWQLRDYYDEVTFGHKTYSGPNYIEKVIVEGLDGNEHLTLGTNPNNDSIFKRLLGLDPAIRDVIINFQKALPPEEREKMTNPSPNGPVSLAIPDHLAEIGAAVSAYYTKQMDLFKQHATAACNKYLASRDKPDRVEKHNQMIQRLQERDANLKPWFSIPKLSLPAGTPMPKYQNSFNPAYQLYLEFFSEPAQFLGREDPNYFGMMVSQYGRRGQIAKLICNQIFTFAVPNDAVLRYIVENAPNKKIAEIGAGSGYWANLLTRHGGDVIANDNSSEGAARYFPVINMDGADFVKRYKGFPDRAILFCWPRGECLGNEKVCMPERTLPLYQGKDLYFVGEVDNGCTFDMELWASTHPEERWVKKATLALPNFLGTDDKFIHFRRD